ncbi:MAG: gamma-glutamyltransferase, partial [Nitrosopumilus sp.]
MNVEQIEDSFRPTADKKCTVAKKGMVSTAFPDATKAGVDMLKKGGNAVDAACASALALGVCEPQASGIGGQSMAIIHVD